VGYSKKRIRQLRYLAAFDVLIFSHVNYVSTRDNYTKLFTLLSYLIPRRIRRPPVCTIAAHRLALELQAVRLVDEAIQDRVGVGLCG
jgi:hypothetical protein